MYVMAHIKGKILYVMPKNVIKENVEGYDEFRQFGDRVEFATYNAFSTEKKTADLLTDKGLVIIDECHHLGSDLYGRNLLKAMKSVDAPILGLTATPIRGRGSKKEDVTKYFENRVDGISNFDAIRLGLMPVIDYRICDPEYSRHDVEYITNGKKRGVLAFDNAKEVIGTTINAFPKDKWICYFSSSKSLHEYEAMVQNLFPDYHVVTLLSTLKNLSEIVNIIKTENKVVILSCNILLEGVHLDGINGIILFRNVSTVGTLQQIIGRVCSIGKKESPVILDCAASARKLLPELIEENGRETAGNANGGHTSDKPVGRTGQSAEKKFNISEFLKAKRFMAPDEKKQRIEAALKRYRWFGGQNIDSDNVNTRSNDYRMLRACCQEAEVTVYAVLNAIRSEAIKQ